MLYPPMSELLKHIPSRYLLVNVVARRARQIAIEAESSGVALEDKPVTLAIREVANGELTANLKDEYTGNPICTCPGGHGVRPWRQDCPPEMGCSKGGEVLSLIAKIAVSAAVYAIDKPYSYAVPPGDDSSAGGCG